MPKKSEYPLGDMRKDAFVVKGVAGDVIFPLSVVDYRTDGEKVAVLGGDGRENDSVFRPSRTRVELYEIVPASRDARVIDYRRRTQDGYRRVFRYEARGGGGVVVIAVIVSEEHNVGNGIEKRFVDRLTAVILRLGLRDLVGKIGIDHYAESVLFKKKSRLTEIGDFH